MTTAMPPVTVYPSTEGIPRNAGVTVTVNEDCAVASVLESVTVTVTL